MEALFQTLETHYKGVLMLLLALLTLTYLTNWVARIFNLGRYKARSGAEDSKRERDRLIADIFARLINDFRHLLALLIVLIFVGLIVYSMAMTDNFDQKMDALQLVIASLGGLLGSIIGYYFGESAVRRAQLASSSPQVTSEGNVPETESIVESPTPKVIINAPNDGNQ